MSTKPTNGNGNKRKQGKMLTSKAKQARVLGRRLAGQTYPQIAKAEHMAHKTIHKIITQEEADNLLQGYRSQVIVDAPELAIKSLLWHLRQKDRQTTIETLYGLKDFRRPEGTGSHRSKAREPREGP